MFVNFLEEKIFSFLFLFYLFDIYEVARILEWVALPSSRGSSQPRDQTHVSYVSHIGRQALYH